MARTSPAGARAELTALFETAGESTVDGVDEVFDFLPPTTEMSGPVALCVFLVAVDPDFWRFGVRLYIVAESGPRDAQVELDAIMVRVEDALTSAYGPSRWDIAFPSPGVPLNATLELEVGREDYY